MNRVAGFTVVPYVSIAYAEVLATSFVQHHPDAEFFIVVMDHAMKLNQTKQQALKYFSVEEIKHICPEFHQLTVAFGREHLASYLRPRIAKHLLANYDELLYFDWTTNVYGPLDDFLDALSKAEICVVPVRLEPFDQDYLRPSTQDVMAKGSFNSGILGINCRTSRFIDWWTSETDLSEHLYFPTDLKFIDVAVSVFETAFCLLPTYGVSYWNLDKRSLQKENKVWKVDGENLAFATFPQFDFRYPFWASNDVVEHPRIRLSSNENYRNFYYEYSQRIREFQRNVDDLPIVDAEDDFYEWNEIIPGIEITPGIRHIYRNEWMQWRTSSEGRLPSPFETGRLGDFLQWLEEETILSGPLLQRFILATLIDRFDIYEEFIHGRSVDYGGLGRWIVAHGRAEQPLTRILKYQPPSSNPISDEGRSKSGVDVIGSLNSEHGLGEAGRLLVQALTASTESVSTISFSPPGIRGKHPFLADNASRNELTVIALNPEQIRELWKEYGSTLRSGRYVIGQWFWELEVPPAWYREAFRDQIVNELWAPTRFIEKMLRSCAPPNVEVRYMPLPFAEPDCASNFSLTSIGLEKKFTFLFTFDFGSVMKRKNPDGVIEAFKNAFEPSEGAQLIIKSINGHLRPREYEKLVWACEKRNDIILIDKYFDSDENAALISESDCYVSLHRSEGLGLTLAEAMLLGKPVIATAYSGNLDFMDDETGYLVPWEYTYVGAGADAYPSHAKWAEPDLVTASQMMRKVFEHPEDASLVGQRARKRILEEFSPQKTGQSMHNRLVEIRGKR